MRIITGTIDRIVAFLLQFVFRYRHEVIRKNFTQAFGSTERGDLNRFFSKYYLYLGKLFRQIIVRQTRSLLEKRLSLDSIPEIENWLGRQKSIILVFGHIGNWEWAGSFVGLKYPDQVCALYKKIKSGLVNRLMYQRRLSHVHYLVEIGQIGELLRLMKRKPVIIEMIADQNPGSDQGIIWVPFLGRETAFVNGPETLAIRYHLPVVYLHIEPKENGKYRLQFIPVYDGLEKLSPGEITRRFAAKLEENIRNHKVEWLWSHRRWKREKVES